MKDISKSYEGPADNTPVVPSWMQVDEQEAVFEAMNAPAPDYPATCDNCGGVCPEYETLLNFPCCLGEHFTCRDSQPALNCPCMCHG